MGSYELAGGLRVSCCGLGAWPERAGLTLPSLLRLDERFEASAGRTSATTASMSERSIQMRMPLISFSHSSVVTIQGKR